MATASRRVEKTPYLNTTRKGHKPKLVYERTETNEDLFQRVLTERGVLKVRVLFQIASARNGNPLGIKGEYAHFVVASADDVIKGIRQIQGLVESWKPKRGTK